MKEILIVAPYQELYETSLKVIERERYENVGVIASDLCSTADVDGLGIHEDVSVIISRGGTYKLIKERLKNVSVIELETSAYDLMNSIKDVIDKDEPSAVIGFDNVISGIGLLEGLKRLNIHKIKQDKTVPMKETIKKCAKNGIRVFIGDTIVESTCKELGYECHLIKNGRLSVISALDRAQEIILATKKEIERNKRYAALIDCVHDGVIGTDEKNCVLEYNSVAREILGVDKNEIIGRNARDLFGGIDIGAYNADKDGVVLDEIRKINGEKVAVTRVPITVKGKNKGYVSIFQDVKKLQNYEKKIRTQLLGDGFTAKYTFDDIIHESDIMEKTINVAKKFSVYNSSVLIQGSSGVGKELFAQSMHNVSERRKGPFVAVNCAALPPSLIESELFGYEEGAFTGSKKGGRAGVFEMAHKGTIFLDEISELPPDIQGRLLRVIQEKEVMRLGDNKVLPLDIRVICATNKDLRVMVEEGKFREDLLFRINTLVFIIPRLDERKEDIQALSNMFLENFCTKYNKHIKGFTKDAMAFLKNYSYQGNVRELRNLVERCVIICETDMVHIADFNDIVQTMRDKRGVPEVEVKGVTIKSDIFDAGYSLKDMEEKYIAHLFEKEGSSAKAVCNILKIDRTTLWRKMKLKGEK